eukprot:1473272-Rhodomonas_salina.1
MLWPTCKRHHLRHSAQHTLHRACKPHMHLHSPHTQTTACHSESRFARAAERLGGEGQTCLASTRATSLRRSLRRS